MELTPRPVADSVEELLDGAVRHGAFTPDDARSPAGFERVELDGRACVVKYVHPDGDFLMRVMGDLGCLPLRVWASGLMDVAAAEIDHAHLGAARWGRNGWGAALLMRDVSDELVPVGHEPVSEADHLGFLDHLAALAARTWGWSDDLGLLPHRTRWSFFGPEELAGEEALGFPEPVPRFALEGWLRFDATAPTDVAEAVRELRRDPLPLSTAVRRTPQCFLHGDWKFGNLGRAPDGRTVLIDWAYPGEGPVAHELGWYLAINRARLPAGHTKESTIEALRRSLEARGVATEGWWDRQLALCLLGTLVEFGWEKALGGDDEARAELGWWIDAARPGIALL